MHDAATCALCRATQRALAIIARDEVRDAEAHASVKAELAAALDEHMQCTSDAPDYIAFVKSAADFVKAVADDIDNDQFKRFLEEQQEMAAGTRAPPGTPTKPFAQYIKRVVDAVAPCGNFVPGEASFAGVLLANAAPDVDSKTFDIAATHWALRVAFEAFGHHANALAPRPRSTGKEV